jgi:pyrimidine-nucleoside phosphorylase
MNILIVPDSFKGSLSSKEVCENIKAGISGYVKTLNAEEVGKIAMHLGAGRLRKEDDIDYSVGVELVKKVGDYIEEKETIAYIYANNQEKGKEAVSKLLENYQICAETVEKPSDILEIIE